MSGLFSIFTESENSPLSIHKGREKLKIKSGVSLETLPTKMLMPTPIKPKGLSVRSNSDLNLPVSNNFGGSKLNGKDSGALKEKPSFSKKSASPIKIMTPKKKTFQNICNKKLSPKISSPIMQNMSEEFVFTKPATPKENVKATKLPEPEKLAFYVDPGKYLDEEIEQMFEADTLFIKSLKHHDDSMSSNEDEGFLSDPGYDSFDLTTSKIGSFLDDNVMSDIELPDLSDTEY